MSKGYNEKTVLGGVCISWSQMYSSESGMKCHEQLLSPEPHLDIPLSL